MNTNTKALTFASLILTCILIGITHGQPPTSSLLSDAVQKQLIGTWKIMAVLTNRRNQNALPVERISSTTAFAPLNNGSTVVIMSRKKAAASVAKCRCASRAK